MSAQPQLYHNVLHYTPPLRLTISSHDAHTYTITFHLVP